MRYSSMFIPTLREVPAEAEVMSHQLMLRAGMIRRLTAGIYSLLPLGYRVIKNIETIVREEMDRSGAQEVFLPALSPAELWMESGRWEVYGKELFRLTDRLDREYCLGPTHEEVVTDIVRGEVRSYRDLPLNLYQIQTKFRDEIRPRFGVMRCREFLMKDAYSFDVDDRAAEVSYKKMYDAYVRIFRRCGLSFIAVEAESGPIGGSYSHEFMVLADTGEDEVVTCVGCGYASNVEKARFATDSADAEDEAEMPLEKVRTADLRTIEEVASFLGCEERRLVKTMIYLAGGKPVAALVRGDHRVNENKLKDHLSCDLVELAGEKVILRETGAPEGFSGPVGLTGMPLVADLALRGMRNMVVGANEEHYHYVGVSVGRDFTPTCLADLRMVERGDRCPQCGTPLEFRRGIEVGHVFKLGTKYSKSLGATFLNADGQERHMVMGCYGIGIGRTAAAAIEQNHDADGIIWPMPIAPFQVLLLPVSMSDRKIREAADELCAGLQRAGVEVLLDDRDVRPGVKFKDGDLLGIPLRLTLGTRYRSEGLVEIRRRADKREEVVRKDEVPTAVQRLIQELTPAGEGVPPCREKSQLHSGSEIL